MKGTTMDEKGIKELTDDDLTGVYGVTPTPTSVDDTAELTADEIARLLVS